MDVYKPNSHRFKEEEQKAAAETPKRVEKVVSGAVVTKKKSGITKLADVFIAEDIGNVGSYILTDVIIPTAKKLFVDIITDGANRIFYGESSKRRSRTSGDYVSYSSFSDRRDDRRPNSEPRPRNGFDYDTIGFETRGDAEAVLQQMDDMIDTFKRVTVADFYDMIDMTAPYTSNKYGWINLSTAEVIRRRDGYYAIKLPKAMPIE